MSNSPKEIKAKVKSILDSLYWEVTPVISNSGLLQLINAQTARDLVDELKTLDIFKSETDELERSILFSSDGTNIRGTTNEITFINITLTSLKNSLVNFYSALDKIIPNENPDSINIKLPPVTDFNDLAVYSKELHTALSQILHNDTINGQTKIESVENGSIWINVLVGSAEAVLLVASLAWSSVVVYKKVLECKVLNEHARSLGIKNESLLDLERAQKEAINILIQAEAEHIHLEHFHENMPENIARIQNSIKIISGLIDKGAKIQPALMTPEKVSNLFPDISKINGIESKIKKLTA